MSSSTEPSPPLSLQSSAQQRIRLDFFLGEIILASYRLAGIREAFDDIHQPPCSDIQIPPPAQAAQAHSYYSLPITQRLPVLRLIKGWLVYIPSQYRHYYICTDSSFSTYLSRFSSKTRNTLRRKVSRIEATNTKLTFRVFSRPQEMTEFHQLAAPLANTTYQARLFNSALPMEESYTTTLIQAAEQKKIFGFILFVNDTPAAYTTCPLTTPHTVLYDYTGYDPLFAGYSPGIVLQFKIIEYLCDHSTISTYDLCTGEGAHKELFTSNFTLCCNAYLLPATLPTTLAVAAHRLLALTTDSMSALLQRLHIKSTIKRLIRRHGH
jgi:CelD/BcsL family acetyltransferase involved in cellulose biosynthesis